MNDSHQRAMSDGKARVASEIIWELEVGAVRLRCRPVSSRGYVVEICAPKGWAEISFTQDPQGALARVVSFGAITDEIARKLSAREGGGP